METINQPSSQPTNKVAAATAATAGWAIIVSVGSLVLKNEFPAWYDPDMIIAVSSGVPTILTNGPIAASGAIRIRPRRDTATAVSWDTRISMNTEIGAPPQITVTHGFRG